MRLEIHNHAFGAEVEAAICTCTNNLYRSFPFSHAAVRLSLQPFVSKHGPYRRGYTGDQSSTDWLQNPPVNRGFGLCGEAATCCPSNLGISTCRGALEWQASVYTTGPGEAAPELLPAIVRGLDNLPVPILASTRGWTHLHQIGHRESIIVSIVGGVASV